MERLQKILAQSGLGSRRACEELILEGRVEVNREVVTALGSKVDPETAVIRVDGEPIKVSRPLYYALNKPKGIVCTNRDPEGRTRVVDLIKSQQRLFTIGRLDKSSEGLILVTNDGALAERLTHPKYSCPKRYSIIVAGHPEADALDKLKEGVHLSDGFAKINDYKFKKRLKSSTVIEIVLTEGRNREIRRLLARIGHKVTSLQRIAIGPIRLEDLKVGESRKLTPDEIEELKKRAFAKKAKSQKPPQRSPHKAYNLVSDDSSDSKRGTRRTKPGRKNVRRKKKKSAGRTKVSATNTGGRGRIKKTTKKKQTKKKTTKKRVSRKTPRKR